MKTIYNNEIVKIIPKMNCGEETEGIGGIYKAGKKIDDAVIYGWNFEEPYCTEPLYFLKLPRLSENKKLALIRMFEEWYGNTNQKTSVWALEFELIVRMLVSEPAALIINPKYLELTDDLLINISSIIFFDKKDVSK